MAGVVVVLILCGLIVPITMLLAALVFDVFVLFWAAYRITHDHWQRAHAHVPVPVPAAYT